MKNPEKMKKKQKNDSFYCVNLYFSVLFFQFCHQC
jgi:hypothetical protein